MNRPLAVYSTVLMALLAACSIEDAQTASGEASSALSGIGQPCGGDSGGVCAPDLHCALPEVEGCGESGSSCTGICKASEPQCAIDCPAPPPGCQWYGGVFTGSCDEVTCGKLVCDVVECETDKDCRLEESYCDGCHCLALPHGTEAPSCKDPVQCFAAPCGFGQSPACIEGQCVVVDG